MFIPATKINMSSTNYDYYTLLTIVIVIYIFCINSLHETNKVLKKKIEEMEVTIKMNTTNTYDKINKLKQEITNSSNNEDLLAITNKLIIINEQVKTYKDENNDDIKKLKTTLKDLNKKLKLVTKEVDSNQFIMTGTYYFTPLLVYKGTDNLLKSIISNNIENSLLLENVEYFNILLSSLVKFKNVKEIELTKIHKYANIIDDDGKIIWSKREDTLNTGYDIVVSYLNEHNVKFV